MIKITISPHLLRGGSLFKKLDIALSKYIHVRGAFGKLWPSFPWCILPVD
jgi:hypothetical protein